ncbi:MAG: hypothetical protein ABW217_05935 [Polyangiaceae bacterium]
MDDHPRVPSVASAPQELPTQGHVSASAHAEGAAASALARPLTHGLFTLPDEEDTVVRAVPEQILALSRVPEQTETITVPRELLELSRREEYAPRPVPARRDESELPVWDAWYGSDFQEEPVFDPRPPQRVSHAAIASPQQQLSLDALSAEDLLWLQALSPARRFTAPAMMLMFAALCVALSCWGMQ